MRDNSLRTIRVLQIMKETDRDHPLTVGGIIRKLENYGLDAERKAVGRDLADLKSAGYNIISAGDNKLGSYMDDRLFEDWELKVLADAVSSARFLSEAEIEGLRSKIFSLSTKSGAVSLAKASPRLASVKTDNEAVASCLRGIVDAIIRRRKVRFDYVFTDSSLRTVTMHPGGTLPVSPFALVWNNDQYYLIGNYSDQAPLSYYNLNRIRDLKILEDSAALIEDVVPGNPGIYLKTFIEKNVFANRGSAPLSLMIRVKSSAVDMVKATFGRGAFLMADKDGWARASISVTESKALYGWLLEHGDEVTVIEPRDVRKKISAMLKEMHKAYGV